MSQFKTIVQIIFYLLIWAGFFLFVYIQYNSLKERHYLSVLPYELNASKTLYVNQESWGFGPGGNETGLIVYELTNEVVNEIQRTGATKFFDKGFDGYRNWQQTPIELTDEWEGSRSGGEPELNIQTTKIENYLDRWGFGIDINSKIESEINDAISKPENFYAYGRTGIIIVIPSTRKAVYAYAG